MAKKFYNTRCVYCLEFFEELTSDHVLPQSWYPDTMPKNLEKWQVPACNECNERYGKLENELLLRFGLCLDPVEAKSLGIPDKVLRSVNPNYGKNERDRLHRQKRREKILKELIPAEKVPKESILTSFGLHSGIASNEEKGILLSVEGYKEFGEKLVRGITYIHNKGYIERDHKVNIYFQHEVYPAYVNNLIKHSGRDYDCGPAIQSKVAFATDDPQSGLFYVEIWGRINMYAIVGPAPTANY